MTRARRLVAGLTSPALLAFAWTTSSCAPSGFADPTIIASVRILASGADEPYAAPGADVTLELLAADERPSQPAPMVLYWIPLVCENPKDDAYYACFQQLASRIPDAGAPTSGPSVDGGLNLEGLLPTGPSFTFHMPTDAVTAHPAVAGAPVPYGLAIIFNAACAGHLEILPFDPNDQNPQAVPVGCFDANHNQLGPSDWVLGYTRVYAYDSLKNANPVITSVDVGGKTLPVTAQPGASFVYTAPACSSGSSCLTMSRCASDAGAGCNVKIGPVVPSSSWEVNPEAKSASGQPIHEEIWADTYASFGHLDDSARLLYDPTSGLLGPPSDTDNTFQAPSKSGEGTIWIVVHDNRGGAAWVTVPVTVQ